MKLRVVATMLWFAAGWSGAGLLVGLAGLPASVALGAGILVSMVVWFDPTGHFWGRVQRSRIRPIEEVASELDAKAAKGAGAAAAEDRPTA